MVTGTVPDVPAAADAWCAATGYVELASHDVEPELAALWGVAAAAHGRSALLVAPGAERGIVRLVETDVAERPPVRDGRLPSGPVGFEFFSRDVDEAYERMRAVGGFRLYAEPLGCDMRGTGAGTARSIRATAPGGFDVFVTTIDWVPPPRRLPATPHLVGPAWNLPVTVSDRAGVERFYMGVLGMPPRFDGLLDQDDVRRTNAHPAGWSFNMLVFGAGLDAQLVETQVHPADHVYLAEAVPGRLRRGTTGITLLVADLDAVTARLDAAGVPYRGPLRPVARPYSGRRALSVDGPAGELVELVETP